jgi:UDP-glucose:(heptosyl)LPS alpha-1,3-glucosyltransferase
LRLAVVSPFVDRRHGTERALAELLERLARDPHCQIHLYAQRVEDLALPQPGTASSQESGAIIWHKVPSIPGPHLLRFLTWLFLNYICRARDRCFHGLRFDLVLSPGINCLHADIVIVHALFHRLRKLARAEDRSSVQPGLFRRLHRRVYYLVLSALERCIYTDPKVSLVAVSSRTAAHLSKYFHRQDVRVIPNGVDTAQFSPAARLALRTDARRRRNFQEGDFVLLLIGNDWRAKGLDTLLRAVSALRESPILVIAAGDDSPDSFRPLAHSLGILDRCRFEPSRGDVLDFYAAADLYVSPSREDSFGMPVAEAMACGLPVITSRQAGVAELIHDGTDGFILRNAEDFQELAQIVKRLREDNILWETFGEASTKAAAQWNWDRNAADFWELLEETCARKAPPRSTKS